VRRALLILAVFTAQFLVFEFGMRAIGGSEAAPAFQRLFMPDPRVGHRLRPGAETRFTTSEFSSDIRINAAGVRGPDLPPKSPGEQRIAVLGDSLVLSVQVNQPQTFVQLLEDRLNAARPSRPYRVVNGGVQGYGPVEELLFYREVVAPLDPDLVIVMVFVANDAIEAVDSAWRLDGSRQGVDRAQAEATGVARRVVRRSMVLQTVRLRVNDVLDWLRPAQAPTVSRPLTTYLPEAPPEVQRGLEVTRHVLSQLADEARKNGSEVALVLVPARFQLNDVDYGHLRKAVAAAGQELLRDKASERFASALAPLGQPMLDLLPALRAQPDPAGLFFAENVHFTPRGHQVVAEALERFVRDTWLPGTHAPSEAVPVGGRR
jgi:lysophospholipase L1-like esterase